MCMCVSPTANVRRTAAPRNEHKLRKEKKKKNGPTAVVCSVNAPPPCTRAGERVVAVHVSPRHTGVMQEKVNKVEEVRGGTSAAGPAPQLSSFVISYVRMSSPYV